MTETVAPYVKDPWNEPMGQGTPIRRTDVRALAEILWRQKWVPILCVATGIVCGNVYLHQTKPQFTARAEIMLDPKGAQIVNLQSVTNDLGRNPAPNQIRVLTSQQLLGRLVTHLRLDKDPEFNAALAPSSYLVRWKVDL
ncbi:MAG: Wzz/FepE/Etk N-terminal domain-containing protein, partial [Paracoccaceae bacterium]